jgi:hypothetical protein
MPGTSMKGICNSFMPISLTPRLHETAKIGPIAQNRMERLENSYLSIRFFAIVLILAVSCKRDFMTFSNVSLGPWQIHWFHTIGF